jgi:signal transduction histidine kinase
MLPDVVIIIIIIIIIVIVMVSKCSHQKVTQMDKTVLKLEMGTYNIFPFLYCISVSKT